MSDALTPGSQPPPGSASAPPASAPLPSTTPPRAPRRLRAKLAVAASAFLLPLLLVEIAARVVAADPLAGPKQVHGFGNDTLGDAAFYESLRYPSVADPWGPPYRADPELGFALEPDVAMVMTFAEAPTHGYHVRTNALGLREDRPLTSKAPGTSRVLAVGDSMTFGTGVEREEAYPALLETELAKLRPVEVVNAGVPCWGQWEETAFLEKRARALAPDRVLLQFTVANDVLDDLRYRDEGGQRVADASLGRELADSPLFHNPLASWSRAYRLFVWGVGRHVVRYRAMLEPSRLERASALIRRARDDSRALGADFALVIAPPKFQVDESREEWLLRSKRIDSAIAEQAARDGIDVLDLAEALRAQKRAGEAGYFAVDMHWTPAGHQAVANALGVWLAGRKR